MRTLAWVLAGGAAIWAVLLPLAALAAHAPAGSPLSVFALAIYGFGGVICHQRPERSFEVWSTQLPVCARCTGIYVGAAMGAFAASVRFNSDTTGERGARSIARHQGPRVALAAALAPAALTLVYEWTTGDTPSNPIRALTGIVLGVVAAWIVVRETLR